MLSKNKINISLKKFIKKLLPQSIINFIANRRNSQNYRILKNPNLAKLKIRYQQTWQNTSLPNRQLKLVIKQLPNFANIAPMKALIDLLKKIETKNKNLLEIGCSSGYYSEVIKRAGFDLNYEGCDYSAEFIKLAKERYPRINFKVSDATNLDYQDNQFDIVISGCCLLHIIDYELAIKEVARVAKNFVIFHRTPIISKNQMVFAEKIGYGVKMLEIFFNENELKELFKKYGLKIQDENTHTQFSVRKLDEPILMKSYLCQKITN